MPPLKIESLRSLKALVGHEVGPSDWFTITQNLILQFAEATEDRQWIHLDRERAHSESPYRTTIAHGFLTLSLISVFMKQAIQIQSGVRMAVNYGLNRVRFPAPVRVDSRIRGRFTLQSAKDLPDAVEAIFSVSVECEGSDKPCCVAEWIVQYYH